MSAFVAAAKSAHSTAGTLTIVFLTLAAFMVGGVISFASRKQYVGVGITAVLAVGALVLASMYYRTYKAG